ncbi:delta-aminolevulinic acid dehydratase isoform X3 [Harpegnathos saltator]|uniref:delta-aminolevulinic acid dehydratase isoform X3 n=1 Tax=Harpegnathos saltator TaxID=610380 RepID=UPI000DBEEA41|nr:delta-aminolevulinic acid dehydratase isoform X3 [Harpegnathos saltator]
MSDFKMLQIKEVNKEEKVKQIQEKEEEEEEENIDDARSIVTLKNIIYTPNLKAKHILHSSIFHPLLQEWQSKSSNNYDAFNLMYPIFVTDAENIEIVKSMPGVYRLPLCWIVSFLEPLVKEGLKSILVFGVLKNLSKDVDGYHADSKYSPVIQAIGIIKDYFPNLVIACDVCLCSYTSLGHCGLVRGDGSIDNNASIKRIAQIALAYANAGAHIVAPSDMMDGRVGAIKNILMDNDLSHKVAVLSYSAKFASSFYGPFRKVSNSAPLMGDRKRYQLPPGSTGLALRAAARDVEEGADMLMVKPGLPYLDIIKRIKDAHPEYPLFVYQVSGEYAMLRHAADKNIIKLLETVHETISCMRRAGADCIITYFTPLLLKAWLNKPAKY